MKRMYILAASALVLVSTVLIGFTYINFTPVVNKAVVSNDVA